MAAADTIAVFQWTKPRNLPMQSHGYPGLCISLPHHSCLVFFRSSEGEHETGMQKGDLVIADHPERQSSDLSRSYGIVLEITNRGRVVIELADGSVIKRQRNSVAVYVHPPSNWKELFRKQEVLFQRPRQSLMNRN